MKLRDVLFGKTTKEGKLRGMMVGMKEGDTVTVKRRGKTYKAEVIEIVTKQESYMSEEVPFFVVELENDERFSVDPDGHVIHLGKTEPKQSVFKK